MTYSIWDILLESDMPLHALANHRAAVSMPSPLRANGWRYHLLPEGADWAFISQERREAVEWETAAWPEVSRWGEDYLLWFFEQAVFRVALERREIECVPEAGVPQETIEHLLLDQVLPMAFSMSGRLVLHASAVVTPEGAVAFVGESGKGKSTLAAWFTRQGLPLLTDDCLLLEERNGQFYGWPSYSGVRVWEDSVDALQIEAANTLPVAHYTSKHRLILGQEKGNFACGPVPLKSLYLLDSPHEGTDTLTIQPVSPREALMTLVKALFRLDNTDQQRIRREFEILGRFVAQNACYHLSYPRDFAALEAVSAAIRCGISEG